MRKCTVLKYTVSIGSQGLIDEFLLFKKNVGVRVDMKILQVPVWLSWVRPVLFRLFSERLKPLSATRAPDSGFQPHQNFPTLFLPRSRINRSNTEAMKPRSF